ncbi:hypothetical protein C5167_039780 [Papaver somniferum]|uniref:No apical meristem-associated C-terminal domain-containing protein n=1 Tax=Papaver somniferum TaxID=3469 RepID=A0A4Y7ID25_PAPSO|nr:hypothetical protein C5167_039780 [Papaver somniferum]
MANSQTKEGREKFQVQTGLPFKFDACHELFREKTRWNYKYNACPIGIKKAKLRARQKKDREHDIFREGDDGSSSAKMEQDKIYQQSANILDYLKETRSRNELMKAEQESQYQTVWASTQQPSYQMEEQLNLQNLHHQAYQMHYDEDDVIMSMDISKLGRNEKKILSTQAKRYLKEVEYNQR